MGLISFLPENLKHVMYSTALSGVMGWAGGMFYLRASGSFPVLGFRMPTSIGLGIVVGASTLVGEIGNTYILPMLPGGYGASPFAGNIVGPTITGLTAYEYFSYFGNPGDINVLGGQNIFLIGAVSHLVGRNFGLSLANWL